MEKQRSFSIKPIRLLVFWFTISFSAIFLILFSTWIIKSIPSSHLHPHSLPLNSSLSTSSIQKKSISTAGHFRGDADSSFEAGPGRDNMAVTDAENKRTVAAVDLNFPNGGASSYVSNSSKVHEFSEIRDSVSSDSADEEYVRVSGEVTDPNAVAEGSAGGMLKLGVCEGREEKNLSCEIWKGKWIVDERYPLYRNGTCSFIDEGFNCEANGRQDKGYMKWRWQPQDCDIPRFNATAMLELMRGKRLVFVGDSLNRNQWESMLCLLMVAVKDPKKVYETRRRRITKEKGNYSFKFEDYKCTVEFYVSHFLVRESKAKIGKRRVQTLRIDTIDKGSARWRGADILVFNTAHWWSHQKTKAGINYYQEGDQVHPQLDTRKAFQTAILTWASWVDTNINPRKTQIFFRSSSPSHFRGGLWNTGGHCKEAILPMGDAYDSPPYSEKNQIVEAIARQMKNHVTFLNVTGLSGLRPDGHPSVYGRKSVNGAQDCSHWCLPGVPDYWNELLFYYLQSRT